MSVIPIVQPTVHTTPLGAPAAWAPVVQSAGGRCQCTGACGRTHSKTGLRCDREHDQAGVRLLVAPADLTLPPTQAARLPRADLRAWCPDCHKKARRRQADHDANRRRLDDTPADALFSL